MCYYKHIRTTLTTEGEMSKRKAKWLADLNRLARLVALRELVE